MIPNYSSLLLSVSAAMVLLAIPGASGQNLRRMNETVEYSPNRMTPLRRLAQPIEIAHAVLFLASDEAAYITGHTLAVTGGR